MKYRIEYHDKRKKFELIREDIYCDVVVISGRKETCEEVLKLILGEK